MAGTVWSEVVVDQPCDEVWRTLLRALAGISDLDDVGDRQGVQSLLVEQTPTMDAIAGDDPIPATIDHDHRSGTVDLRQLPDVPAGLRGAFELVDDGASATTVRLGITTEAWWGGAAAAASRVGFLRRAVAGDTEQRMHDVVREVVDLAVDADDEELRDLVQRGTPTTRRLADERRQRLADG